MSEAQAHQHDKNRPWFLAHHWENPQQQFEAGKLGMWLFLATEVLLFGGLFCGYAIWRGNHPELFKFGSQYLDTTMGAINTAVLIASSLTMAWGVTAAQQNKQGLLKIMLGLTFLGALAFLGIKYVEYSHKFNEGIYPGMAYYAQPGESSHWWDKTRGAYTEPTLTILPNMQGPSADLPPAEMTSVAAAATGPGGFNADSLTTLTETGKPAPEDAHAEEEGEHVAASDQTTHHLQDPLRPRDAHMFFNIYFMMTGLHGIHVVIGLVVIGWLFIKAQKGQFSDKYFTPVDLGGLYWHVVDLIWIFLFPLFYLI